MRRNMIPMWLSVVVYTLREQVKTRAMSLQAAEALQPMDITCPTRIEMTGHAVKPK